MGKLYALAVMSLLSLFMFLWYQEYIQSVCVSSLLCSGYDSEGDEVGLHQTQNKNVCEVKISERIVSNTVHGVTTPLTNSLEIEPIPGDKNIIFIETRCLLDDSQRYKGLGLSLHKRQACAIESAARMNPDYKVYLLYSCPIQGRLQDSSEYVQTIFSYPNVKTWKLNIEKHFSKTPLEKWDFQAAMKSSEWPKEHSSDVLRFLTLWKYGGTYLDLDVVILK
jgi:lactosylceramide 4-alpha-galactosyltransferase